MRRPHYPPPPAYVSGSSPFKQSVFLPLAYKNSNFRPLKDPQIAAIFVYFAYIKQEETPPLNHTLSVMPCMEVGGT